MLEERDIDRVAKGRVIIRQRVQDALDELAARRNGKPVPVVDRSDDILELRVALEQINPFLKALHAGDTIEMARTLGIINQARDKYPLDARWRT